MTIEHKLLFFGPAEPCSELRKDMAENGVARETEMGGVLSALGESGWVVVYRSYCPEEDMRQWRIALEREIRHYYRPKETY